MKKLFATAGIAAFFLTAAAHAEEAVGAIQSIDPEAGVIVLEDGTSYVLAEGMAFDGLQPGDLVTVSFENMDGKAMVKEIVPAQ